MSVAGALALVVAIQTARVFEIVSGHAPSAESNAAFGLAITALIALVGTGRTLSGGK